MSYEVCTQNSTEQCTRGMSHEHVLKTLQINALAVCHHDYVLKSLQINVLEVFHMNYVLKALQFNISELRYVIEIMYAKLYSNSLDRKK